VFGQDVETVAVTVSPGFDIQGSIVVENPTAPMVIDGRIPQETVSIMKAVLIDLWSDPELGNVFTIDLLLLSPSIVRVGASLRGRPRV
jgi:hypothetical protein